LRSCGLAWFLGLGAWDLESRAAFSRYVRSGTIKQSKTFTRIRASGKPVQNNYNLAHRHDDALPDN